MSSAAPEQLAPPVFQWEDLNIPETVLLDLTLRRTLMDGKTSVHGLSRSLGVTLKVAEYLARDLRDKKLIDFERMIGHDWVLALTEAGRAAANDSARRISYVGTAPVSLEHYCRVVLAQRSKPPLNSAMVTERFSDIVISEALIAEVGPAMMSTGAIFLYGPPGTGKSTIAERMARLLGGPVLVPRAIEVDGQIISVFDPTAYVPIEPQPEIDPRWVLCRRPCIIVGGELERSQLDLTFDPPSGLHLASVQMKANNGLLVIDDFGRQRMTPTELLNRWIVPLDRHIDYLTLTYGVRFDVPFDSRVVFSTNLPPESLGDDAFFRRLPNKVFIGPMTVDQFDSVLYHAAVKRSLSYRAEDADYLRATLAAHGERDLRAYVPGVVCDIAVAICAFDRVQPHLSKKLIDRIAWMYFTWTSSIGDGVDASWLPAATAPGAPRPAEAPKTPSAAASPVAPAPAGAPPRRVAAVPDQRVVAAAAAAVARDLTPPLPPAPVYAPAPPAAAVRAAAAEAEPQQRYSQAVPSVRTAAYSTAEAAAAAGLQTF